MNEALVPALLSLIVVLQLALLAIAAWGARKAWWSARLAFEARGEASGAALQATQQIEHLAGLYLATGLPPGSLPPTRGYAASADFLRHVFDAARRLRPRSIVECGSGLTTAVLARAVALAGRGHVWSIDHDPYWARQTETLLRTLGLEQHVTLVVAPLEAVDVGGVGCKWYAGDRLDALPDAFDMVVVDGPPVALGGSQTRYPAGPVLLSRLSARGEAFFDDASRTGDARVVERLAAEHGLKREALFAEKGCARLYREGAAAG